MQIAGTVDYQIGMLYRERGYGARSIEAFERIQTQDPAAIPARRELAVLYEQANRLGEAVRSHQIVLAAIPGNISSLVGTARVYKRMGDRVNYDNAIAQLRSLYPGNTQVENEIRRLESAP